MTAREKPFATEAALCAAFIAAIGADWVAYAETAGWDILLVRKADGLQIGIQAKLKLNAHVISQASESGESYWAEKPGPDCRAVLVPAGERGFFHDIAAYIGLTIIGVRSRVEAGEYRPQMFHPCLPSENAALRGMSAEWFELAPARRHEVPAYVPDVAAGASAPLQLTAWKISAIKIAVTLAQRGFVTRRDFKAHGIDYRRWIAAEGGWLVHSDGAWIAGERLPDFKAHHPRVWDEIAADAAQWMPDPGPVQRGLLAPAALL